MAAVALWQNSTLRLIHRQISEWKAHPATNRWWAAEANTTKAMAALLPAAMLWREDCTPVRNVEFNCHPCGNLSWEKPTVQTPDSHLSSVLLAMLGLLGPFPPLGSPHHLPHMRTHSKQKSTLWVSAMHVIQAHQPLQKDFCHFLAVRIKLRIASNERLLQEITSKS